MRAWIDHTGLHGAGRCLNGEAQRSQDLRGLLQLATLIIFADSISFSGFESAVVDANGQEARDAVVALGLDANRLASSTITPNQYAAACEETAELAASEWPDHLRRCEIEDLPASFDVPNGAKTVSNVPRLIKSNAFSRLEGIELLRQKRAMGAVEYMIRASDGLRNAVSKTVLERPSWGVRESYRLESFLRATLNDRLAQNGGQTYFPAVSRSEQLASESAILSAQIERSLREIAGRWRPQLPSLPRVSLELIRRGKGHPAGMISEALEMRTKTRWLRHHLRDRLEDLSGDPFAPGIDLKRRARFERHARSVLGIESEPHALDALEVKIVLGLPLPTLKGAYLYDWIMHHKWKRRLIALTDLRDSQALRGADDRHMRTFVECATGRRFPH